MKFPAAASLTRLPAFVGVTLLWAAIYLPGLGSLEIKGEEGRRLLPAVSMLETGRWIVPSIGGVDYLSKPPLINWLAAAAFAVAGDTHSEWAARAPSVLAALALGLCAVGALARWLGQRGALLCAVFLLTNIGLMEKGRLAEIEALYLSLTGIAILLWLSAWRRDLSERNGRPSWQTWTLPWLFLGLGLLTKGPLHLLFFYAVVAGVLICAGRRRDWFNWPHLAGVALMLAIFAAWAVPYLRQTTAGHSGGIWWEQFQGRLEVNEKFQLGAWLLNVPRGLVNYLPWTVLLPLAWWRGTMGAPGPADADRTLDAAIARGLRWAVAGCFLAVSLAPGGQPRYTLPLLTPASVLLALVLTRGRRLPGWLPGVWGRTVGICLAVATAGAVVATVAAEPGVGRWIVLPVAVAVQGLWTARWRGSREWPVLALASAAAMAVLTVDYAVGVIPRSRGEENVRRSARQIDLVLSVGSLNERPAILRPGFLPFLFYLRHRPIYVQAPDDLPPTARFLLVRKEDEPAAAAALRRRGVALKVLLPVDDKRTRGTGHEGWFLERLEPTPGESL